ncbi:Na+/H+ antiporter NhaA [Dactylosporangium sp. NPDC000555]|uniref:Na+/H+ antiporter NhaA n=1 Tax=Dactylosporangium sp. NPDC000555 TaxID=3154260 RepID=UPI00332BA22D
MPGKAARFVTGMLRTETAGGVLLLVGAGLALAWANSPWSAGYERLGNLRIGPAAWHLDLTLAAWAADALLAVFFFVAGLELKRELVAGDLRDPRRAVVPVAAAVGGMVVPALIYVGWNAAAPAGDLRGWAVPTATDIAFALAVLALAGPRVPSALRTFLLTLAVVDDLLAIVVIAVFYTAGLSVLPLLLAVLPLAAFAWLLRRPRRGTGWLLAPLAAGTWLLVHASGVHATVAGVLLAFAVPVRAGAEPGVAARLEHRWRPVSAGVAVPVFAFFAAGVPLAGAAAFGAALRDPAALGVLLGLTLGKPVGVLTATWLARRAAGAAPPVGLGRRDMVAAGLLSGIGFTVSLLIAELAFGAGSTGDDHVRLAILVGSGVSAVAATLLLRIRRRPPQPSSTDRARAVTSGDEVADDQPS